MKTPGRSQAEPFALDRFEPPPEALYTAEQAAHIAGIDRHIVFVCCRHRVIQPRIDSAFGGLYFDGKTVDRLRVVRQLRRRGVNMEGVRVIFTLLQNLRRAERMIEKAEPF